MLSFLFSFLLLLFFLFCFVTFCVCVNLFFYCNAEGEAPATPATEVVTTEIKSEEKAPGQSSDNQSDTV